MIGAPEAEIKEWQTCCPYADSTGIITKHNPAVDIDLKDPEAATAAEELAFTGQLDNRVKPNGAGGLTDSKQPLQFACSRR